VLVAQHLHLDVAGMLEELLDVDAAVAEGGLGLLLGRLMLLRRAASLWQTRMPRPPPPAAALMMTG
jgi:hypothetical protein